MPNSPAQSFSPDQTRPKDGNVMNIFTPHKTVMPMVMAIVLIVFPGSVGLGCIVAAGSRTFWRHIGGQNRCAIFKIKGNVALQVNRVTSISTSRKSHNSPTSCVCSLNRTIDRGSIDSFAIAHSTKGLYAECTLQSRHRQLLLRTRSWSDHSRGGVSHDSATCQL